MSCWRNPCLATNDGRHNFVYDSGQGARVCTKCGCVYGDIQYGQEYNPGNGVSRGIQGMPGISYSQLSAMPGITYGQLPAMPRVRYSDEERRRSRRPIAHLSANNIQGVASLLNADGSISANNIRAVASLLNADGIISANNIRAVTSLLNPSGSLAALDAPAASAPLAPAYNGPLSTNRVEHVGTRNIRRSSLEDGGTNLIGDSVQTGTEMVELHGDPNRYFTKNSINGWISSRGNAATNPVTRAPIRQRNMRRYTARVVNSSSNSNSRSRKSRKSKKSRKSRNLRKSRR